MKRTLFVTVAALSLLVGGAGQALTITPSVMATADGGIVTVTVDNPDNIQSSGGYDVLLNHDSLGNATVTSMLYNGNPVAQDPNALFGSASVCNGSGECRLMNGGAIGSFVISDSVAVVTWSGLAPGTVVSWNFGGNFPSPGLPAGGSFTVVPEPMTASLLGLGLLGIAIAGRRR